ncbi:MAG: ATP-binding cassette domain-containing protein [Spirochaetales bacterium]|nr:ATP-binding cassette domain-containing protein [Spirochaetales bacterium]
MVELKNVSYKIGRKELIPPLSLSIKKGECWALTGANGSGKTLLGRLIAGDLEPSSGEILGAGTPAYVSFEKQSALLEEERQRDDSRFLDLDGAENPGRTVTEWIGEDLSPEARSRVGETIALLGLERAADRGLRYLSTGEFRKTMICRALLEGADFLIMDDPYDGLDHESRENLRTLTDSLIEGGKTVLIVSGREEDFSAKTSHLLIMEEGKLIFAGTEKEGKEFRETLASKKSFSSEDIPYQLEVEKDSPAPIVMKGVSLNYGEKKILNDLNWQVNRGDKWLLTGQNGAGKSTILSLINGDNPKAYGCDITLFGSKKGSGESIWEIKKRIGHISGGFQIDYRVRSSALAVVLSGYFDSVGLYNRATEQQKEEARRWLRYCGLEEKGEKSFRDLSFGEQRMLLIARAMIKSPELLILDEPCQGLDDFHRDQVLALCARLGSLEELTMLYVSHSPSNTPNCLTKHLALVPHGEGGYTGHID